MSIIKNQTAAVMVKCLGNKIGKLKKQITTEPENTSFLKKLKESQRTYVILAKEAYYTII